MNSHAAQHLKHAGIYLFARGIPGLVAFLAIPVFSRLLDPEEYGRYAVVVAIVATLNAGLFQWLRLSLVRFLPAQDVPSDRLKSTLASASLLLVAILGVVAVLLCFTPHAAGWRSAIGACWVLVSAQALFDICCEATRAALSPLRYMALQVTRTLLWLAAGVGLITAGWGWKGPIIGLAIAMLVAVLTIGIIDWRGIRLRIDRALLVRVFRYGMPISLTVLLVVILTSIDRWMLAGYHGERAAGVYSVAVDFVTQTIVLLMLAVNMAVFPVAVRAWEQFGSEEAMRHMASNISLLAAVGVPAATGAAVLAPGLATCLLGPDFREAAIVLIPVAAIGGVLASIKAYHFDAAFQFVSRTMDQVYVAVGVGIVNVILNLLLIPRMGPMGACISTVTSFVIAIVATVIVGRRHLRLPWAAGEVSKVLVASGAMAATLFPFRSSIRASDLAIQILAGVAIYGAFLLAMNFLGSRVALIGRLRASPVQRPHATSLVSAAPERS